MILNKLASRLSDPTPDGRMSMQSSPVPRRVPHCHSLALREGGSLPSSAPQPAAKRPTGSRPPGSVGPSIYSLLSCCSAPHGPGSSPGEPRRATACAPIGGRRRESAQLRLQLAVWRREGPEQARRSVGDSVSAQRRPLSARVRGHTDQNCPRSAPSGSRGAVHVSAADPRA